MFPFTPLRTAARTALIIQEGIEEQSRKDSQERRQSGEQFDELRARQAAAYTRDDIGALLCVELIALGELRMIRWLLLLIAASLVLPQVAQMLGYSDLG